MQQAIWRRQDGTLSSLKQHEIESIVAGAKVFAVGKHQAGAEDAQLGLRAGIEEPLVRAERVPGSAILPMSKKGPSCRWTMPLP